MRFSINFLCEISKYCNVVLFISVTLSMKVRVTVFWVFNMTWKKYPSSSCGEKVMRIGKISGWICVFFVWSTAQWLRRFVVFLQRALSVRKLEMRRYCGACIVEYRERYEERYEEKWYLRGSKKNIFSLRSGINRVGSHVELKLFFVHLC